MQPHVKLGVLAFTVAAVAVPTPPPQAAAAPGPHPAAGPQQNRDTHTLDRANPSPAPLAWGTGLALAAQEVANKCVFANDLTTGVSTSGFPYYGQNIAGSNAGAAAEDVTRDVNVGWYGEEGLYELSGSYGQPNPVGDYETGSFTQIVWAATTAVGCAIADCPAGLQGAPGLNTLFICDYGPGGNIGGEYAQNVHEPLGEPSID